MGTYINEARNIFGEYCHLVHELRQDNNRFFQYFRMETEVFDKLLRLTGPLLYKMNTNFRDALTPSQRLPITLR